MATKKQEEKLNKLWRYLQKISKKEDLQKFNMRAFLYSVRRISYEQALIELVGFYLNAPEEEIKKIIEIMEE